MEIGKKKRPQTERRERMTRMTDDGLRTMNEGIEGTTISDFHRGERRERRDLFILELRVLTELCGG